MDSALFMLNPTKVVIPFLINIFGQKMDFFYGDYIPIYMNNKEKEKK